MFNFGQSQAQIHFFGLLALIETKKNGHPLRFCYRFYPIQGFPNRLGSRKVYDAILSRRVAACF